MPAISLSRIDLACICWGRFYNWHSIRLAFVTSPPFYIHPPLLPPPHTLPGSLYESHGWTWQLASDTSAASQTTWAAVAEPLWQRGGLTLEDINSSLSWPHTLFFFFFCPSLALARDFFRFDDAVGQRDWRWGQRGRPSGSVVQRGEQWEEKTAGKSAQGVRSDPQGLVVWAPLQRLPLWTGESPFVQADPALYTAGTGTDSDGKKIVPPEAFFFLPLSPERVNRPL